MSGELVLSLKHVFSGYTDGGGLLGKKERQEVLQDVTRRSVRSISSSWACIVTSKADTGSSGIRKLSCWGRTAGKEGAAGSSSGRHLRCFSWRDTGPGGRVRFIGRSFFYQCAPLHHRHPAAELPHHVQIVRNKQHGDAGLLPRKQCDYSGAIFLDGVELLQRAYQGAANSIPCASESI